MPHSVTRIKMQKPPVLFSATVTYITDSFPCHIKFQQGGGFRCQQIGNIQYYLEKHYSKNVASNGLQIQYYGTFSL